MSVGGALAALVVVAVIGILLRDLIRLVRTDGYGDRPDRLLPRSHAEPAYGPVRR